MQGKAGERISEKVTADIYSSSGNDYLVFKWKSLILNPIWVNKVCKQEGVDGIAVIGDYERQLSNGKQFLKVEFLIYNLDGSFALVSGNGIASASEYIMRREENVSFLLFHNEHVMVTSVPKEGGGYLIGFNSTDVLSSMKIVFKGMELEAYYLEMPNPHLIVLLPDDADLKGFPLEELAEYIRQTKELDTNISVVMPDIPDLLPSDMIVEPKILSSARYKVRVWERGVGETGSCGSAAAAITNLLMHLGVNMPLLTFHMPGGVIKTIPMSPMIYLQLHPKYIRSITLEIPHVSAQR